IYARSSHDSSSCRTISSGDSEMMLAPGLVLTSPSTGNMRRGRRMRGLLRHVVVVVLRICLEPGGQRVETRRLRRELTGVGIGAAHDQRQRVQRRILELVLLKEGVERAFSATVPELHVRNIVRDRAFALRDGLDLTCGYEQERRVLVDKSGSAYRVNSDDYRLS